ncbi:bifunctional DNA primase/polymerase [Acidobacteriia bacterium AH_259_A11_L15]|nr:bifunctional DNA primase/polymerase [Acidobacteriia bacterium AH_259_A11_L15]
MKSAKLSAPLDGVRDYLRRGWAVVPVARGEKAPRVKDWPSLRLTEADVPAYFSGSENVGVILGEASGGLIDLDLDTLQARLLAPAFLPRTEAVLGRPSNPASHWLYLADPLVGSAKFQDTDGKTLLELRSSGCQTVFPPSQHSGEIVAWYKDGEPARSDGEALRRCARKLAVAALLARHWPAQGSRNDCTNAVAGMLLRASWSEDKTAQFIEGVAQAAGDEEVRQRVRDVVSTQKRLASGRPVTGTPTLASIVGGEVVERIRAWLGLEPHRKPAVGVSPLVNEIRRIALAKELALFDKRRDITHLIDNNLRSEGQFFRTRDGRAFFFHNGERRLYDVEQSPFQRLLTSISGLSSTENFLKFALDLIQTTALRSPPVAEAHMVSCFDADSGSLAVSDGGPGIWIRERGGEWEQIQNGDSGFFFLTDDDSTRWVPEFSDGGSQRWWLDLFLFADYGLSVEDSKTLIHVWLAQQFFPLLRRTRAVPCFLGAQGSGKTTAMRLVGRLLVGEQFDVTGVRRDKEDAFVAAVTNRSVLALDNADSRIPWLPDTLATYATGQRYRLRKLYTTNEEVSYSPRAILLVSSRDPRFNRPDVTERLLPLHFERPEQYRTEEEIFGELEKRRGQIMGSLLLHIGTIADALRTSAPKPLPFRMADFASFGERIFEAHGKSSEFLSLLKRLERKQAELASEFDGVIETLRILLEREPVEAMSVADLHRKCSEIAQENNLLIARSAQGFGHHLSNMRRVLEIELGLRFVETRGHARKRLVSLVASKPNEIDTGGSCGPS